ncbi:HET-domain-containing protein [Cenococcum geophilum 1.58]|uniref:HET-domain-containing protein n=1 Tax=Cenococcum geophilum 1.58 TaxID=794803 RepID=UPI00358FBBB3|nr:HET-domain-containing protein [Cenococcum geophilum 1.58]
MPKIENTAVLGLVKAEKSNSQKPQLLSHEILKQWGYICPIALPTRSVHPRVIGRSIEPDAIDYELIKSWVRFCTNCHVKTCRILDDSCTPPCRLIDCSTRKVVEAPKNCQYVAMSYVWGIKEKDARNYLVCTETGLLPKHLPTVIEDAMTVVRSLDLQYLWVDRYCIIQNDDTDVLKHMGIMDLIYNHAHMTIIAAAGSDPSFGLPGVGSRSRIPQPCANVKGHVLVSTLPDPQDMVKRSKWMERAWVYQEALFSIRRLIFTEHQVYFECNNMHCHESIQTPLEAFHTNDRRRYRTCIRHGMFRGGFGKRCWPLTSHIQKYSEKALTYQSDILRGMLGIFRAFEKFSYPIHHILGVPIEFDMDLTYWKQQGAIYKQYRAYPWKLSASFARGLCWSLQSPAPRRDGFPSWSWTGWAGSLREWLTFEKLSAQENPGIEFRVALEDGSFATLHELYGFTGSKVAVSKTSQHLDVEAWTIQILIVSSSYPEISQGSTESEKLTQQEGMREFYAKAELNDGTSVYSPLILSKQPGGGNDFVTRLHDSTWDCIVLSYRKQASRSPVVMVIEDQEDGAERIGLVDFWTCWSDINESRSSIVLDDRKLLKTRRKIRLS